MEHREVLEARLVILLVMIEKIVCGDSVRIDGVGTDLVYVFSGLV